VARIVAIIGTRKTQLSLFYLQHDKRKGNFMLFALFYVIAITVLVMHFTGFLARHNLEWLVLVLAAAVFPAVIYL
jgi:Ca2+/Na+ antiporter